MFMVELSFLNKISIDYSMVVWALAKSLRGVTVPRARHYLNVTRPS